MKPIEGYAWKDRVLIVFAAAADPKLRAQLAALEDRDREFADRDMAVFAVIGDDRIEAVHGTAPADEAARALRADFEVPVDSPFTVLLIGKDGGVKWRDSVVAQPQELFGLIDAMPMRRSEMQVSRPGGSK